MNINHRHYVLLCFALGAAVLSVVSYFILFHRVEKQAADSTRISSQTRIEEEKKKHEQDIGSIFQKSADDRARVAAIVVSQSQAVNFIKSVEQIGEEGEVSLDLSALATDEFAADSAALGVGHVKAHIDAIGSWKNIMRTLLLLENLPYSSSVNNVRLVKTSATGVAQTSTPANTPTNTTIVVGGKKIIAPVAPVPKTVITSPVWKLSLDIRALTSNR